MSNPSSNVAVRDVRHLGDFTVTPRMVVIALLALPVGAVAALAAWSLLQLIGLITNAVFYQRTSTELVAPGGGDHPWWLVLLAPVVGGLVIGVMARYGSEKIRGHGMPEAIEAILLGGSKVQPRVAVLKPTSSAIAIGTGGPFGAEGPIIMTGGALGSLLAQFLHLTADERKTLLVAGSAAGMAATFNSPLAALLLAAELLLFEFRPRSLVPVAGAVAVGTVLRHHLLGEGAVFPVTGALHLHDVDYALCVVSGLIAALLALVATVLVYASEDAFRRLPIHWMWWPAIGGVLIGLGGLLVPEALGVGYDVIEAELSGEIGLGLIVGILVVKTLVWSLSLGSGTSGGVLAPMFMIGGALGALESHLFPAVGPGFWALVALAGVLGGVMRSPLTGVVFALELTHQWDAILPVMIGSFTAYGASALILKRSVLTEKIARRGYHLSREYDVDPLEITFVSEVMTSEIVEFTPDLPIASALTALEEPADDHAAWRQQLYPVTDDGAFAGVVARGALLGSARTPGGTIGDLLVRDPVHTHSDQTLRAVAETMAVDGITTLPVLDRDDPDVVVGVVSLPQLLAARRRDQQEARDRERVLRVRLLRPTP
ncbi:MULTISPECIES: chloride channel protein [unclassified Nocardioides]|uniref:chloride channel protein n=1 Tax=unclassified Nocardioides TaxID=2615069 RepID=UPI000A9E52BE|nr:MULTISPECIES: chloride channel protein [unclassified Nocardioides]